MIHFNVPPFTGKEFEYMYEAVTAIIIAIIIIIPPIVGVPCFFKWDAGPSSLSICPTFNFFNIGIIINPQTTEITNVASNTFISKSNFIKPS